jgi:hypothetical protein
MSAVHDSDGLLSSTALQHVWDMQAIATHAVTLHDFLTMQCRRWRISPPVQLHNECSPDVIARLMTRLDQLQRQMESPAWRAALSLSASSSSAPTTFFPIARPIFQRSLYNLGNSCWFNASFVVLSHMLFELHGKAPWVGSAAVDDTWRKLITFCEYPNVAINQESETLRRMFQELNKQNASIKGDFTFNPRLQCDTGDAIRQIVEFKQDEIPSVLYRATAFTVFSLRACNQCMGGQPEKVLSETSLFQHAKPNIEAVAHIVYLPFPPAIPKNANLHLNRMLQDYFAPNLLPDCSCANRVVGHLGASRILKFAVAPEYLVIQLTRNQNGGIIRVPVDIPDNMPVDYYPDFQLGTKKTYWYRLVAAVIHLYGDASGHYVVMVQRTVNNVQQWVFFNDDAIVRTMSDSEVFRMRKSAYLLVYKQQLSSTLVFASSSAARPAYHIQTRTSVANGKSSRSSSTANAPAAASAASSSTASTSVSDAVI